MEKILPALVLRHILLELLEVSLSGTELLNNDVSLLIIRLQDQVSVRSLHSEVIEFSDTLVSECDTGRHHLFYMLFPK